MKLIEIKDLIKKDSPVLYRKEFTGSAVFETLDKKTVESRILFVLEDTSMGSKNIQVDFMEEINYPLVSIVKRVKEHIVQLEKSGKLV